jgi:cold shock protein
VIHESSTADSSGCIRTPIERCCNCPTGLRCRAELPQAAPALRRTPCNFDWRHLGTVKWFNPTKGYGFIQPDDGGNDVFVHISAVEKAGLSTLGEGARVSYELFSGRGGKTSAEKLRVA